MSATPKIRFGIVEDSDEDFVAFSRVVARDAPGTELTRWSRAEATLESLAGGDTSDDAWPAILVVDLNLPGIDGCQLVERLRATPATRTLPVFILSGSTRQVDIDRCYAAGANAYLTKPGSAAELRTLLQMLFRSLACFQAPTPLGRGPVEIESVEQDTVEEARQEYERQLVAERDAERRARERAEGLQRIAVRLANLTAVSQIESALIGELIGSGVVEKAELERVPAGSVPVDAFFAPQLMADGTTGIVPVLAGTGTALAQLRVEGDAFFDAEQQSFVVEAAALAGQALERASRTAMAAKATGRSSSDLPAGRWFKDTIVGELRRASRSKAPLCVVAVELDGFDKIAIEHGAEAADRVLLSVVDAWRRAGHDLISRHGGEEFAAILSGFGFRQARLLISEVRRVPSLGHAFSTGIAQWDGREDAAQLLGRADAALAEERRLRAAM